MLLTDSHAHLFLEQFNDDVDEVIQRAINSGVERFFLPNIDSSTIEPMIALAEKYPDHCFPMMGLHPSYVKEDFESELETVLEWHVKHKFCAVGEIGIDLYWETSFLDQQLVAFRKQIALAKDLGLPIVIHVRESFDEVFEVIDELNDERLGGIFHCFTGTVEQANQIISYGGFKLGIGGVLTFKNSGLDATVKEIEMQHLVLETDAPYLTPSPHRGQRNESAYIKLVAEKLAEIKEITVEEVADITTVNTKEIFGI